MKRLALYTGMKPSPILNYQVFKVVRTVVVVVVVVLVVVVVVLGPRTEWNWKEFAYGIGSTLYWYEASPILNYQVLRSYVSWSWSWSWSWSGSCWVRGLNGIGGSFFL
jgi:hypothetical protein